ncbi:MAG: flavin reductase family protein [Ruminococcus sp.]|uniref:flavin reductase family protein n=1 Tax=Ruminococcus sp. TaxID=41978 RepID=UPI0025EC6661|nr:flavin reductase family protein [Ruminococcus sp.]MCR5539507.1 flavin reductase family protein [Ruminococcus sp.]
MKIDVEKSFVTPLPVFIIATYNAMGQPNAMNAAWVGQVGRDMISISLGNHPSTENIKLNRAFTVSYATKKYTAECDYVGIVSFNKEPEKLKKAGFTVTRSQKVNAPIIDQLPVAIECEVVDIMQEYGETRITAKIVGMVADDSVLTVGKVDLTKLQPIMYDSSAKTYRLIGENVGGAWNAGKKFMG